MSYAGKLPRFRKLSVTNAAGSADRVILTQEEGVTGGIVSLFGASGSVATPASGYLSLFSKSSDGRLYQKDSAGVEKKILAGLIADADVAAGAAIAYSKLAALTASKALVSDSSGVVSVSAVSAVELGYVAGVTSAIQSQINGKLSLSGGVLTGALTLAADPSSALHAATKQYVDNLLNGIRWKAPVRASSVANVNISSAPATIDGVTLAANDRVLLKNQSTASENGIYVFSAAAAALTRAQDFDSISPIDEINGAAVITLEGSVNADKGFVVSSTVAVVGTDAISFVQFTAMGSIVAGTAIDVTGQTVSAKFDSTTISVNGSNQLQLSDSAVTNAKVASGAAIAYSKLNLAGSIVNADINSAAAIAYSKLALSNSLVNADINASAAIAYSKLALSASIVNADINASAAIAYSKLAALTVSRALTSNASGVITVSAVTDTELGYLAGVTSGVQTQLDGKLSLTGGTLTGALTLAADPTLAMHAVPKQYVDALLNGLRWKAPVRAASVANVSISSAPASIDGVTLASGNRILLKDQSTASQNGIYVFTAAASALTRAVDFDSISPIDEINGAAVITLEGTVNADKGYVVSSTVATLGTDAISFVQFTSAGSVVAGTAIDITGQTVSVKFDNSSIAVNGSNQLEIKALGITDAHVSASAAIAGTKISPDFGSQNIETTGNLDIGGTADFLGSVIMSDYLVVQGSSTFNGNVTVSAGNQFMADGESAFYGNVFLNKSFMVNLPNAKTTSGLIATDNYYVMVDSSAAVSDIVVNLPAAATAGSGRIYVFKDKGGMAGTVNKQIIIDPDGSELIDGALTYTIDSDYASISVLCTGTGWLVL